MAVFNPLGKFLLVAEYPDRGVKKYGFRCPGCCCLHVFTVGDGPGPRWSFDGDIERPTFDPSLMVNRGQTDQCHLFVREGRIEFCGDCHHHLPYEVVPMVEIDGEAEW